MSVLGFYEKAARRGRLENGILTAQRIFQLKTSLGDKENIAVQDFRLPSIGSLHDVYSACWCNSIDWQQQGNSAEWTVTCNYSSERELNEDPTAEPAEITWDGESYTEVVFVDINGDAIVNSAGDYFVDPTPTREKTHLIAKIKKNVSALPTWVLSYRDVVNSGAINIDGLPIGAKLAMIRRPLIGPWQERNDIPFRELTIDVHIHPRGWKLEPMDVGFREKDGSDRIQIKDGNDDEPTTPVPLDGSGNVLANPTPSNVVFLDFEVCDPVDFTILPGISS
ncbi:hypothetical protein KOR42_06150 [Thalassoglobus neptunius]|uniref:Uncharacterized protein n=1 Tax=Thalassoglobus neptunius TaxID=1938619 RepID=A0A5C5X2K0_9PLAN|nr:hypothetical protein [Thalassoglobus neptunius]TWT57257.1 hypothetical protein KOR42_06150 [Thalassoglobus neptunius]